MILSSSLCIQIHLVVTIMARNTLTNDVLQLTMFEPIGQIGKCCTLSFVDN